jgi:hypothetical protein
MHLFELEHPLSIGDNLEEIYLMLSQYVMNRKRQNMEAPGGKA